MNTAPRILGLVAALILVIQACGGEGASPTTTAPATTSSVAEAPEPTQALPDDGSTAGTTTVAPATTEPPVTSVASQDTIVEMSSTAALLAAEPNPIAVDASLDADAAGEAILLPSGGDLEVVADDGTIFTLSVPRGALITPQRITVTPVAGVNGLPLSGGLVAGVQLEPEGLQLLAPAILEIRVPDPSSLADLVGFGYQGGGDEFHLLPFGFDGSVLRVHIPHFSGYGIGSGTPADVAAQSAQTPTQPGTRMTQALAIFLTDLDACFLSGDPDCYDDDAKDELESILRDWYVTSVKPKLLAAESDELLLPSAAAEYLDWLYWVFIFDPMEIRLAAEIDAAMDSLAQGLTNAIDAASQRCVTNSDPTQVVDMINWWAMAQQLAIGSRVPYSWPDIEALVRKCAVFALEMDSVIDFSGTGFSMTAHVKTLIPLDIHDDLGNLLVFWDGAGSIFYQSVSVSVSSPDCSVTSNGIGSTATVKYAFFNLNPNWVLPPGTHDILVVFDPGEPRETYTVTCPKGADTTDGLVWYGSVVSLHQNEIVTTMPEPLNGQWITDWAISGGPTYATRVYQQSMAGGITENTVFRLLHTPSP